MIDKIISEKRKHGEVTLGRVTLEVRRSKTASELAEIVNQLRETDNDADSIELLNSIDKVESKLSKIDQKQVLDNALKIAYSKEFDDVLKTNLRHVIKDDKRFKNMNDEEIEEVVIFNLPTSQKRYRKIVRDLTIIPAAKSFEPLVYKALFGSGDAKFNEIGKELVAMVDSIVDKSAFTVEQAKEKFEKVLLMSSAQRSINASKFYNNKDFKKDAIEFFRLTNGKLELASIQHTPKQRRAYVTDDGADTMMETGINFKRSTAWHELGHLVEFSDKTILNKSIALLKRRLESSGRAGANGGGIQRLSKLTGMRAYKVNEVAIDDGFVSYYTGKIYGNRSGDLSQLTSTEVISTGFEMLSNERGAAKLLSQDPEHFKLVMLAIKGLHK